MRRCFFFVLLILVLISAILAQQPYEAENCNRTASDSSSALGYLCNGVDSSCETFLVFRSRPPRTTVTAIADLLPSSAAQIARANAVNVTASFQVEREVIVPINCSCSGNRYQVNASYTSGNGDTFFSVENGIFQGLSTCQAVLESNRRLSGTLTPGDTISVPLRCACPTKNQTDAGVRYLLTYLIKPGDTVSDLGSRFDTDTVRVLNANMIEEDDSIYDITTLLIPLMNQPSPNQTRLSPPPPPPPPPSPPVPPPPSPKKKTWIWILIAVIVSVVFLPLIGFVPFFLITRKKKTSQQQDLPAGKDISYEESMELIKSLSSIVQSMKVYSYEELRAATDEFNRSYWLGGSVYRGVINGDLAAIKRVKGDVMMEVDLLKNISHLNIIRLSGVCFHAGAGDWYLVYEYAANGALSEWICKETRGDNFLNLKRRLQIAADIATGLNYLHNQLNPRCIHKNLQSSHVLLDSEFRAKISNFSLAVSAHGQEEGQFAQTRHIIGTTGYMAPEYLQNGFVSPKLDVYSFGILLLELISGEEDSCVQRRHSEVRDDYDLIVDPSLLDELTTNLRNLLARLIVNCLNADPSQRPTTDEIVQSLLLAMDELDAR